VSETVAERRERQAQWLLQVLDVKGSVDLPPEGWRGWSAERHAEALLDLHHVVEAVREVRPLTVVKGEDGTIRIWATESLN
jgi:hypothetical protein